MASSYGCEEESNYAMSIRASASAAGLKLPLALPPRRLLESLSKELRQRLGLQLFNMDIIREGGAGNRYYVIDINYFPGLGKLPDFEEVSNRLLI